jgi:hypothetical protein
MIGQYPFAAIVGQVIDYYGPWACSLISSVLFSLGFQLFSREIAKTPDDISQPSVSSFRHLALYFFMVGLATVFSYVARRCSIYRLLNEVAIHARYFSSLFAASKNFPNYLGIASGTSMALFGLSPLFLSLIASNFFTDRDTGLDVTSFLQFMAMFAGVVHLIGAFTLRTPPLAVEPKVSRRSDTEQSLEQNEHTALLSEIRSPGESVTEGDSVLDLFRDTSFWVLTMVTLITLGSVSHSQCSSTGHFTYPYSIV